jgi:threonine aldolase
MGGGMRQSGYLAACGIVALEKMVDRLAEDHENARKLAEGLAGIDCVRVDPRCVETNIVFADTNRPAESFVEGLREFGVWALALGPHLVRFVTHRHIGARDIERALIASEHAAVGKRAITPKQSRAAKPNVKNSKTKRSKSKNSRAAK